MSGCQHRRALPATTTVHIPRIWLLSLLVLASCGVEDGKKSNPYGLTAKIQGDGSLQRSWVEPHVDTVSIISEGEEYILYEPGAIWMDNSGLLYIADTDFTIKAFTAEGNYVATYGGGRGRGPGQMMTMTDGGVWNDSLFFVADPRQRRVSFFHKNGDFVRSENYDPPVYRIAWANDNTKFIVPPHRPTDPFLVMMTSGRRRTISQVTSREIDRVTLMDGYLHASQGRAVYVPFFIPAILTYSPDDTIGTAYTTPDYGHPLPTTEGDGRPSPEINGMSIVHNGVLSVQKPAPETDSLMFDLYNASEMKYMYSIRLASNGERSLYGYGTGTVAALRDTSVVIYEINIPQA